MRCLILLLISLLTVQSQTLRDGVAATTIDGVASAASVDGVTVSGGGGPTYLLNQNFTGAGYDNSETWTEVAGTPNEDYTAVGGEALSLDSNGGVNQRVDSPTFTALSTAYGYFQFRVEDLPASGNNGLYFLRTNTTVLATIAINSTGNLRISHGTANSSYTVDAVATNTFVHVWWSYAAGTGLDGVATIDWSTDGTKPTPPGNKSQSVNTGSATGHANNVRLFSDLVTACHFIFDRVLVDNVVIGSSP